MSKDLVEPTAAEQTIGLVAIGRNEGDRLKACLNSAIAQLSTNHIVYVDSGSTDDSVAWATNLGITVLTLDLSIPFTAARARNSGYKSLYTDYPQLQFIQFIDGDCQLATDWCTTALATLVAHQDVAVVCGRRREKCPEQSVFNQLCDMEWNTPIGEALACGGDALIRVSALQQVDGYRGSLIAGEEPELCLRLRRHHWRILRIDADMTWHDAQITHFSQWWQRTVRAGHAYAEGAWLHGAPPEHHWVRESLRSWIWGFILPITILATLPGSNGWSLSGGLVYVFLAAKICWNRHSGHSWPASIQYALFCVLGKIPEAQGQLQFHWHRITGRTPKIVEYK